MTKIELNSKLVSLSFVTASLLRGSSRNFVVVRHTFETFCKSEARGCSEFFKYQNQTVVAIVVDTYGIHFELRGGNFQCVHVKKGLGVS